MRQWVERATTLRLRHHKIISGYFSKKRKKIKGLKVNTVKKRVMCWSQLTGVGINSILCASCKIKVHKKCFGMKERFSANESFTLKSYSTIEILVDRSPRSIIYWILFIIYFIENLNTENLSYKNRKISHYNKDIQKVRLGLG